MEPAAVPLARKAAPPRTKATVRAVNVPACGDDAAPTRSGGMLPRAGKRDQPGAVPAP